MEQIIYNIRHCTGCAACSQVCPCGAVVMEADEEGFLYPNINEERCSDCGLCRRTCPVNAAFEKTRSIITDTDGSLVFTAGGRGVPVFVSRDSGATGSGQNDSDAAESSRNGCSAAGTLPDDIEPPASGQEEMMPGPGGKSPSVAEDGNSNPTTDAVASNYHASAFSGKRAFACRSKSDAVRGKSSSGGVFSELAAKTLEDGGVVFGAAFDEEFNVKHRCIENIGDLDELRRSKYVQSEIGESFKEAEKYLEEGRKVLFCGTPCQIAGLKAYLGKEYDNLTTCDIACFGVPSPKVWRMFLDYLEDRYGGGITSVSFRDKSTGWRESSVRITFDNGAKYMVSVKKELYLMGYFKNLFTRKSCFDCRFKVHNSHADLTLADFWGIEKLEDPGKPGDPTEQREQAAQQRPTGQREQAAQQRPTEQQTPMEQQTPAEQRGPVGQQGPADQRSSPAQLTPADRHDPAGNQNPAEWCGSTRQSPSFRDDNRGISLVITHTGAGEKALSGISGRVEIVGYPPWDAARYNPRLVSSLPEPTGRTRFFADMKNGYSFDRLRRKYMDNTSIRYKLKCIIKKVLGRS